MFLIKRCAIILAVLILQSCGPSSEGTPSHSSSETPKFHKVQAELKQEIDKYELECQSDNCPEYIGMLVAQQDKMRWRCTAFFIDDHIMATAAHCLPKHLKTPGKSCDQAAYVVLAGRKTPIGCKKILEVEQLASGEFDYAFFEIQEPQRLTFPISIQRQGRYNKQKIKIPKVDPLPGDLYKAIVSETRCELNNNSLISLYFNGPRTPQIQYSGCQTISGNSGAPIMNQKGQVIGIHHSSVKPNSPTSMAFASKTTRGQVDEFGSGTNFGCLCPVGESYRRCLYYKSCRSQNNEDYLLGARQNILDRLSQRANRVQGIEQFIRDHKSQLPDKYFSWTAQLMFREVSNNDSTLSELKMYLSYRPSCVKNQWKFKDLPIANNEMKFEEIPFCELDYTLDPSLRLNSVSNSKTSRCSNLKAKFKLQDPNSLVVRSQYETNQHPFASDRIIPYCD